MKGNIHYIRVGDYEIPDLKLPEEIRSIGHWGRMQRDYLREYHPIRFNELILTGELWAYLADLNEQAEDMFFRMVREFAEKDRITETLKAENQMLWVQRMNAVQEKTVETIYHELIYT